MPSATQPKISRYSLILGFITASAPVILYSAYRTGFQIYHFASGEFLRFAWLPLLVFTALLVTAQTAIFARSAKTTFVTGIASGIAIIIGISFYEQNWYDYKLWVYITAPMLLLTSLASGAIVAIIYSITQHNEA